MAEIALGGLEKEDEELNQLDRAVFSKVMHLSPASKVLSPSLPNPAALCLLAWLSSDCTEASFHSVSLVPACGCMCTSSVRVILRPCMNLTLR